MSEVVVEFFLFLNIQPVSVDYDFFVYNYIVVTFFLVDKCDKPFYDFVFFDVFFMLDGCVFDYVFDLLFVVIVEV